MFLVAGLSQVPGSATVTFDAAGLDSSVKALVRTSLLEKPSPTLIGSLRSALSKAPLDVQLRWVDFLKARMLDLTGMATCQSCGHGHDLVISLNDDSWVCVSCDAECSSIDKLANSFKIPLMDIEQRTPLRVGDTCIDALHKTLDPLLRTRKHLIVIDRFLYADAIRAEGRQIGSSGLYRLMHRASQWNLEKMTFVVAEGAEIRGRSLSSGDIVSEMRIIRSRSGNLQSIMELHVVSKTVGREKMHDRWVAAQWPQGVIAIALGKGIGSFDGTKVRQSLSRSVQVGQDVASAFSHLRAIATSSFVL